jgi:hypothetical protein
MQEEKEVTDDQKPVHTKKESRWIYECKTFWNGKLKTLK